MNGGIRAKENERFGELEKTMKIFAEKNRLAILSLLKSHGEKSVGQIADRLGISFKAVSKHLLYLTNKGLLSRRYDGPFVLYSVSGSLSGFSRVIIAEL